MKRPLDKVSKLRRGQWWLLLRAQGALLRGQFVVWTRSRGRMIAQPNAASRDEEEPRAADPEAVEIGRALELAVSRAARYGVFRPTCLVCSLALQQMLRSRGYAEARVQVGVRFHKGRFQAHAWVEHQGLALGDGPIAPDQFERLAQVDTDSRSKTI